MEEQDKKVSEVTEDIKLPDNAYRELKEGESYKPILLGEKKYPELNAWTITWGIIMAIIFSAATVYFLIRFTRGEPQHTKLLFKREVPAKVEA